MKEVLSGTIKVKMEKIIKDAIVNHTFLIESIEEYISTIKTIASIFINALRQNKKIIFFGNGGSAADAQHLAAELVGRFKKTRRPMASIALNTNSSIITAVGNDFGFENIFSSQIEALGNPEDVAVGISTSGVSENIVRGILKAKERKLITVVFSGKGGGKLKDIADINLIVPSYDTARIQEVHIFIGHIICEIVENEIS